MKRHLFAILVLIAAVLPLSGCSGEEAAPTKAAVDVKAVQPPAQPAAKAPAAKAAGAPKSAVDAQKSATAAEKPATPGAAAKASAAAAPKPGAAPKASADTSKPGSEVRIADADVPLEELPPPLTVPQGYRYEPRGRRDPFVNPVPKPVASAGAVPVVRPDGLPGVLVSELKVSGIIYAEDPSMKKAILAAGRKTYFAKQGDHLFDAVVKEIRPNEVVFMMVSTTTKKPLNRETVVATGSLTSRRR